MDSRAYYKIVYVWGKCFNIQLNWIVSVGTWYLAVLTWHEAAIPPAVTLSYVVKKGEPRPSIS